MHLCHICVTRGESTEAELKATHEEIMDEIPTGRVVYVFSCEKGHVWTDVGPIPIKE